MNLENDEIDFLAVEGDSEFEQGSETIFLMSFADIMMIICCFFVILFSVSNVQTGRFEKLKVKFTGSSKNTMLELYEELKHLAAKIPQADISNDPEGIRINLNTAAFFESASAKLITQAIIPIRPILYKVLATKYSVSVEGHTDNQNYYKKTDYGHESNWTLSGLRAASVIHDLVGMGFHQKRLKIVGHAANKPIVLYNNKFKDKLEKARARNRRVSILIH